MLFDTPGRVWSLGATLAQTLFDGGLRRAHTDQAIAAYDVTVAQYKQTVLTGFQQVEDDLATLRVLDQETALQDDAVRRGAARRAAGAGAVPRRHRQLPGRRHGADAGARRTSARRCSCAAAS